MSKLSYASQSVGYAFLLVEFMLVGLYGITHAEIKYFIEFFEGSNLRHI